MDDLSYAGPKSSRGRARKSPARPTLADGDKAAPRSRGRTAQAAARTAAAYEFPAGETAAEFTGERFLSTVPGPIRFEHHHRYIVALPYCEGRDVLDIASGEGYGSAFLAKNARSVVGVDIDPSAVATATEVYKRGNLSYRTGSCTAIPLDDASVDVIVSFETLEHFQEQDEFFVECKRVLRPGGVIIISTPDKTVFSPPGVEPNPYHIKELSHEEFSDILSRHFDDFSIIGQAPVIGSLISPVGMGRDPSMSIVDETDNGTYTRSISLAEPMYLIAIIGAHPPAGAELLNGASSGLALFAKTATKASEMEQRVVALQHEVEARDHEITRLVHIESDLRSELGASLDRGGALVRETQRLQGEIDRLAQREHELNAQLTHAESLARADSWRREAQNLSLTASLEAAEAALSAEITANARQAAEAIIDAARAKASAAAIVEHLRGESEARGRAEADAISLRQDLGLVQTRVLALEAELDVTRTELSAMRQSRDDALGQARAIQELLNGEHGATESLRSALHALELDIDNLRRDLSSESFRANQSEAALIGIREAHASAVSRIDSLTHALANANLAAQEQVDLVRETREILAESERERLRGTEANAALEAALAQERESHQAQAAASLQHKLRAEILAEAAAENEARASAAHGEAIRLQVELEQARREARKVVETLQQELTEERARADLSNRRITELELAVTEGQAAINAVKAVMVGSEELAISAVNERQRASGSLGQNLADQLRQVLDSAKQEAAAVDTFRKKLFEEQARVALSARRVAELELALAEASASNEALRASNARFEAKLSSERNQTPAAGAAARDDHATAKDMETLREQIAFLEKKRAEGGVQVQGLQAAVKSCMEELDRRQAVIDEIRASTTWKLARGFAKLGKGAPKPIRGAARTLVGALQRHSAGRRVIDARRGETLAQASQMAPSRTTGLQVKVSSSNAQHGQAAEDEPTATFAPPAIPKGPSEPEASGFTTRQTVAIVLALESGVQPRPETLTSLEAALSAGVEVVLCSTAQRRLPGALMMPASSNVVELVDRVIRASACDVVVLLTNDIAVSSAVLEEAARIFVDNPDIVATNATLLNDSEPCTEDFKTKSVRLVESLLPGVVAFDVDAYTLVGGLRRDCSGMREALADFSARASAAGFSVALNPFMRCTQDRLPVGAGRLSEFNKRTRRAQALFVDMVTPTPDRDCGSLNLVWNIRILKSLGYECTFITSHERAHAGPYTDALRRMGVHCVLEEDFDEPWKYLAAEGHKFSLVMLYRVGSACHLIDPVQQFAPQAKVIFNTQDLHFLREERGAKLAGSESAMAAAIATRNEEFRVMNLANISTIVSTFEMEYLRSIQPDLRLAHIPVVNPIAGLQAPASGRSGVMFVGGFGHHPNKDAVLYFVADIWPRVRRLVPDAQFYVIGSNPPPEVRELHSAANGVIIMGFVENLGPWYRSMRVNVAPLRYGGGVKGKVISSLSVGLPTVATSMAVEGMGLTHGVDAMVADDPEAFARCVAELCSSDETWDYVARQSVATARKVYSVEAIRDKFVDVLRQLDAPH